jgi:membrane-associated phospholipid phosphatase
MIHSMLVNASCKLLFFFFLAFSAFSQNPDIDLLKKINIDRNKKLDNGLIFISNTVSPVSIGLPLLTLGVGLAKRDATIKQDGLYLLISPSSAYLLNTGIKSLIKRPRPYETYPVLDNIKTEDTYSFPSGHTSAAFNAATSLVLAYPKYYVAIPAYLWAGTAAYSRMHLGVHYPSDVLGGILVGSGTAFLSHKLSKKLFKH